MSVTRIECNGRPEIGGPQHVLRTPGLRGSFKEPSRLGTVARLLPPFLQIARAQRTFRCGNRQQRGIELYKRCVHGSVLGVTGIAVRRSWNHISPRATAKSEKRPFALKPRLILHVDFAGHHVSALKIATLIDRSLVLRATHLQYQLSLIRPGASFLE